LLTNASERKKSHDKVYPKGYVEMLEQQQAQLVSGLQEMYRRMRNGEPWTGPKLSESTGQPLTHDILAGLGLLERRHNGDFEPFEEDFEKIQSRLIADGAEFVHRRSSFSSDSDRSHTYRKSTTHSTPTPPVFEKDFTFSAAPSPAARSPVPRQRKSYPVTQQSLLHRAPPLTNDPQLFQPQWSRTQFSEPENLMRSDYAMKTPQLDQSLDQVSDMFNNGQWNDSIEPYDINMGLDPYQQQTFSYLNQYSGIPDYTMMSSMDLDADFKQFVQVAT